MKNTILEEIKDYAIRKLGDNYSYCGVADSNEFCQINSSDSNESDIVIKISITKK